VLTPKQSVDDIVDGQRRGYNADERKGMDWWSHRLLVIPAVGADTSWKEVHNHFLLNSQISVGWPKENRRLSKAPDWGFLTEGQCLPFLVGLSDRPGRQTRCQAGTASSTSLPCCGRLVLS
jgi:hypothetical protein